MGFLATIILAIARVVLSEGAVKVLEGWLKPKPADDGFQAVRRADEAAGRVSKEPTDADPNRLPPN